MSQSDNQRLNELEERVSQLEEQVAHLLELAEGKDLMPVVYPEPAEPKPGRRGG